MAKIRQGFVSNSSSSSFIVIDSDSSYSDELKHLKDIGTIYGPSDAFGETEFGWQIMKYDDSGSKFNFCMIQAREAPGSTEDPFGYNNSARELLEEFAQVYFNSDLVISNAGYIDHASSSCEGVNMEMFKNLDTLADFILGNGSCIINQNDNGGEYYEN